MPLSVYARFGLSTLTTGTQQTLRQHTVIAGETLPKIAAAEYQTGYSSELWRQIAEYNSIDDIEALTVGTVLVIPAPKPAST